MDQFTLTPLVAENTAGYCPVGSGIVFAKGNQKAERKRDCLIQYFPAG